MNYLSHDELPESQMSSARVIRSARYITMDEKGHLWCTGINSGPPRKVPPLF
jgi:hypothetical protein